MDTASPSTSTETPAGDPAPATDPTPGDTTEVVTDPATTVDPAAEPAPAGDPAAEPAPATAAPAPKPRVDLTARLARMSREKREAEIAARAAVRDRDDAKAKLAAFDSDVAKAQSGDLAAVRKLLKDAGLQFRTIVDAHAEVEDPADLPPDQRTAKEIESVRSELAELKKAREDEAKAAQSRAAQAAEAEVLATVTQTIGKQGEKFEICARLGEEAARDVLKEVTGAWEKAGRPQLMPGEFDEAVMAAIEVCEMRYEERGQKLIKRGKTPATAAAPGATDSTLAPASQGAAPLSDKDEDILKGLIDKTAPLASSQRAKPKTIGSGMGGSAPPRDLGRGDMDPREALRAVLAQQGL